jgi:hypothetical protein
MRHLPIADYLDQLARQPAEKAPPIREISPFRPRSLASVRKEEVRSGSTIDRSAKAGGVSGPQEMERPRTPWDRQPLPLESARRLQTAREADAAEEVAARLAEAHARGRAEGLAEGRAEASNRHVAELAAARQQAQTERLEFQFTEYAKLEGALRTGLLQIEENVGAALTRILAPFLSKQVVKRAVDELCRNIALLCAPGSTPLITIRGSESALALLRPRIASLPAEVVYVENQETEVVATAGVTQIATEIRPWAELLASLDD